MADLHFATQDAKFELLRSHFNEFLGSHLTHISFQNLVMTHQSHNVAKNLKSKDSTKGPKMADFHFATHDAKFKLLQSNFNEFLGPHLTQISFQNFVMTLVM